MTREEHPRSDRVERMALATCLPIYAVVWGAALLGIAAIPMWAAFAVTANYVGFHVYESRRRGHCLMSADSTAIPTSLVVLGACYGIAAACGVAFGELGRIAAGCTAAVLGGHVLAIAWCAIVTSLAAGVARGLRLIR